MIHSFVGLQPLPPATTKATSLQLGCYVKLGHNVVSFVLALICSQLTYGIGMLHCGGDISWHFKGTLANMKQVMPLLY